MRRLLAPVAVARGAGARRSWPRARRGRRRGAQDCSAIPVQDNAHYATDQPSAPLAAMGVDDALARLKKQHVRAGEGVTVAVIDSGVSDQAPITFAGPRRRRQQGAGRRPTTTAPPWPG